MAEDEGGSGGFGSFFNQAKKSFGEAKNSLSEAQEKLQSSADDTDAEDVADETDDYAYEDDYDGDEEYAATESAPGVAPQMLKSLNPFKSLVPGVDPSALAETTAEAGEGELANVDQREAIVQSYVVATLSLSEAQALLAEALGLKEEAAKIREANDILASGKVEGQETELEKHHTQSKAVNEVITLELAKQEELSAQSRQQIAKSLLPYANGLYQSRKVIREASPFLQSMMPSTLNPFELAAKKKKFATAWFLLKKSPGFMSTHAKTVQQLISVCRKYGIEIPKDESLQNIEI